MTETVTLTREDDAQSRPMKLPSPEQVERAARLVAVAYGEPEDYWKMHSQEARAILMVTLNLARVEAG